MPVMVDRGGVPVSSCCRASLTRSADYTDSHVYQFVSCETAEDGVMFAARYRFVKTYDGLDAENVVVSCDGCGAEVDVGGEDLYES